MLLALTGARIEGFGLEGGSAEDVDLALDGPRGVVVGEVGPLLALFLRRARVISGEARVLGRAFDDARADVGVAPCDPPLLGDVTPLQHVTWAARLAGMSASDARRAAIATGALTALGPWLERPLGGAPLAVRRVTVLAAAAVDRPALLFAESPLASLDAISGATVLAALGRLVGDRAAIVSTSEPEPGSPASALVEGASAVVYR